MDGFLEAVPVLGVEVTDLGREAADGFGDLVAGAFHLDEEPFGGGAVGVVGELGAGGGNAFVPRAEQGFEGGAFVEVDALGVAWVDARVGRGGLGDGQGVGSAGTVEQDRNDKDFSRIGVEVSGARRPGGESGKVLVEVSEGAVGDLSEGVQLHECPAGRAILAFGVEAFVEGVNDGEDGFVGDEAGEAGDVVAGDAGAEHVVEGAGGFGSGGVGGVARVVAKVVDPEEGIGPGVDGFGPEVVEEGVAGQLRPVVAEFAACPGFGVGATQGSKDGDELIDAGAVVGLEGFDPGVVHGGWSGGVRRGEEWRISVEPSIVRIEGGESQGGSGRAAERRGRGHRGGRGGGGGGWRPVGGEARWGVWGGRRGRAPGRRSGRARGNGAGGVELVGRRGCG